MHRGGYEVITKVEFRVSRARMRAVYAVESLLVC